MYYIQTFTHSATDRSRREAVKSPNDIEQHAPTNSKYTVPSSGTCAGPEGEVSLVVVPLTFFRLCSFP